MPGIHWDPLDGMGRMDPKLGFQGKILMDIFLKEQIYFGRSILECLCECCWAIPLCSVGFWSFLVLS